MNDRRAYPYGSLLAPIVVRYVTPMALSVEERLVLWLAMTSWALVLLLMGVLVGSRFNPPSAVPLPQSSSGATEGGSIAFHSPLYIGPPPLEMMLTDPADDFTDPTPLSPIAPYPQMAFEPSFSDLMNTAPDPEGPPEGSLPIDARPPEEDEDDNNPSPPGRRELCMQAEAQRCEADEAAFPPRPTPAETPTEAAVACPAVTRDMLPASSFKCTGDSPDTRRCVFRDVLIVQTEVWFIAEDGEEGAAGVPEVLCSVANHPDFFRFPCPVHVFNKTTVLQQLSERPQAACMLVPDRGALDVVTGLRRIW
jgi:hypothetical protein